MSSVSTKEATVALESRPVECSAVILLPYDSPDEGQRRRWVAGAGWRWRMRAEGKSVQRGQGIGRGRLPVAFTFAPLFHNVQWWSWVRQGWG